MSNTMGIVFDLDSAIRFNSQHARAEILLFSDLVYDHPGLTLPRDSAGFAHATRDLQQVLFSDEIEYDGKFGSGTWRAAQTYYAAPPNAAPPSRTIIRSGVRVPVDCPTTLLTWEDPEGLDLHRDGGWSRRSNKPDLIVVHWGGREAKSCRNALASRDLSSHFGTDRGIIYQWLDTEHNAWHAGGKANRRSIGIDICQQPTTGLASWYESRGYGLDVIPNPSSRGEKEVLTLHPATIKATADLLRALTSAFDIPLAFPDTDKVLSKSALVAFSGIVGHHHVSKRKWDIAPWIPSIAEELGDDL